MKKLILLLFIPFLLVGCYSMATVTSSKSFIGMTIAEFKNISMGREKVERLEPRITVYKMINRSHWDSSISDTRFFYFVDGKLVRMDGGQLRAERIEVIIKN